MTSRTKPKQAISSSRKWVVCIFLVLHLSALVHSVLSSNTFFPPPERSSQFSTLRDAELLLNRRGKTSPIDSFLHGYEVLAGVSQQWNTFAPLPARQSTQFRVVTVEEGVERTIWSNGVDLDGSSGWFYNPNTKLSEAFYFNLPRLHQSFLEKVAPPKEGEAQIIRLEAESVATSISPDGEILRSPKRTNSILSIRR